MDPNFHVSSARFSYSFQNFSHINKLTPSPACWIQNLPWKIFIEPVVKGGKKYMSVYVGCTESGTDHWSCRAVVEVYKLHGVTPKIIRADTSLIFDSAASTSWGHVQFILWDVVSNPVNGFIKDDAITVEVTITAELPDGMKLTPYHYTDERANRTYFQWIEEKLILEEKIESLIRINEEKETKIISYIQSIEELKKQIEKNKIVINQLNECQKNLETERNTLKQLQVKNEVSENSLKIEKENGERMKKEIDDAKAETKTLQENLVTITKQLDDLKKITESSDSNKLCDAKLQISENENLNLKNKLTSIEDELKNSSVKLQKQIENHASEIKSIEKERDNLKQNLEVIAKNLKSANEELSSLKTTNTELQGSLKTNADEFIKTKEELEDQIQNLNKTNQNLNNEKTKLDQQISTLQAQKNSDTVQIVQEKQNLIDNLKTENQNLVEQMKLGYEKYSKLLNEKNNVDSQLKASMDYATQINEKINSLQESITTKQKELTECKENLAQMQNENVKLTAQLNSSNVEINDMKNNLNRPESDSNDMTDLKNYCEKLKTEVSSLITSITDSRNEIQGLRNKFKKRTTEDKNSNLQIDLNTKNDIKNSKLRIESEKLEEIEGKYKIAVDAKRKLQCEMEILRKKLEKNNKDAYETFLERNKNMTRELNELQFKLEEEKNEKLRILDEKRDVDDELKQMKQENEVQIKTKTALLCQLRECHQLSKEVFWIIIELVKIKKSQDQMPCSIEARLKVVMEMLSKNKRRAYLRSTSEYTALNQPLNVEISTEVIQKRLDDLEMRLQKEIEIVSSELKSERCKRIKLLLSNERLSSLLENEMVMRDQYKKLVRVNEIRSQEIENRLCGSFSQLSIERNKRFQYEEDYYRLFKKIENIEVQSNILNKSIWKKSLELCDDCSCYCSEDFSFNSVEKNGLISTDSFDVRKVLASCDSDTSTDEGAGSKPQFTAAPNAVTVKQSEEKNDEAVGKTESARITESNPISHSNAN